MNIYQRVAKVMERVAYIRKDKKVESYMAVTHDAVTAEVRPSFLEHGIVISPTQVTGTTLPTGTQTAKGTPIIRYEATYDIRFINKDDPADMIVMRVEAHANDHGDKAPGKALSYATKYAVLKLLMIETGEHEEGRYVAGSDDAPTPIDPQLRAKMIADYKAKLDESTKDTLKDDTRAALTVFINDEPAFAELKAHAASRAATLGLTLKAAA